MEFVIVHKGIKPYIALVELNRPGELNALNAQLVAELATALQELDQDEAIRVIILTGNNKAFAAGADIKEMVDKNAVEMLQYKQKDSWSQIRKIRKPTIAAVSGYCLGGGCELAMTCDMIIAAENAQFGQPEIKLGIIPGAGGTQRLTRAIGKAKAMELILTGRFISAREAESWGLINRVVPAGMHLEEALRLAGLITQQAPLAVQFAKDSINQTFETYLEEGLDAERKNASLLFATEDQKEGMRAFIEKRKPVFKGK